MEQNIRQRLIGACVLLALGIIFLSWLYEPVPHRSKASIIPEPPQMPEVPEFIAGEQERAQQVDLQVAMETQYQEPKPEPESRLKESSKPELEASGVPKSWTLQMGVFANQDNAKALVVKLQKLGYKAYSRTWVREGEQRVEGVYVGPMVDRDDLFPLRDKLQKQVKLKGVVVRYHP
ncbi:SPOR domain-containing protein [Aestuariirhabdus sp. Z084]|uniref:SPOR domain-containing protein n=1 Tax=Aestuariirhabdus haliotis TaxID=2918751 RepID=UPI00201B351E|nr:SPOR domain-containing protein [Aestuariirhabdus haliotis]MCL6414547.1 SPOR domain-containing protein [Aestuariirhabdus haliotis]MCL6418471.1 SPOR domain-containing protein [Aestuariirhabdus haliotis]